MVKVLVADLREAFQVDNLHRAWRWLNSNNEAQFKSYFRHIYTAYAISIDENLDDLHKRLIRGTYQPYHATKLYLPKKSGIQRTYTLLTVEDQIVYQALVNVVAERLLPIVRGKYNKVTFGNLYAGQRSQFFYQKWQKGYRKFSDSIRNAFSRGFVYTASFDLTACYDSIDHIVLGHFLADVGLTHEFIARLCEYLKHWTAALAENRIYQGHGIPQGPISSGLLAEAVLRYFDDNHTARPRSWRYFRYVDDIRFFAKNERDLRALLIEMDLLSKQIGLFPQSGKISIHQVTNVEDEIKSISNPPEPTVSRPAPDQALVRQRLKELSPRHVVTNETRFKFVLSAATPNAQLGNRLIEILSVQPHLYGTVFNYFRKYTQISRQVSSRFLHFIRQNALYATLVADGLRVLRDHCDASLIGDLSRLAESVFQDHQEHSDSDLRGAAISILIKHHRLNWQRTTAYFADEPDWWPRSDVVRHIDLTHIGKPSYETLINDLLADPSVDVSVVAAEIIALQSLSLIVPTNRINPVAQLSLRKMGLIQARRSRTCPISTAMQQMLGPQIAAVDWKDMLGHHYQPDIPRAINIRALSETNATAWVNMLDTFHDDILDNLFTHDGTIGNYRHGNIGGVLYQPTSLFATKYPRAFRTFHEIHEKRLASMLSHSVVRSTGRRTRAIQHGYIGRVRPRLVGAYLEIMANW